MNFLGDVCKAMNKQGFLEISDLYKLSESEIIDKIETCQDEYISSKFKEFRHAKRVFLSPIVLDGKYCVNVKAKRRYINPLVETHEGNKRIYDISLPAKICIDSYLNEKYDNFGCFEFDFKV